MSLIKDEERATVPEESVPLHFFISIKALFIPLPLRTLVSSSLQAAAVECRRLGPERIRRGAAQRQPDALSSKQ